MGDRARGAIWGLVAGAVFGLVTYAATRGQRDFVSHQSLRAGRYDVTVEPRHADTARTLLGRLG